MRNYFGIWKQFNRFVISLDVKPNSWEDRVTLFMGYKIDNGMQSSTVKSYVSAIEKILVDDGYPWNDQKVLLGSLTKACRIINDTRLPIQCGLLELLLFEIERIYDAQYYLQDLYKTLFALAYYGMMRISEVTLSDHVVKAKNVQCAVNKERIRLVLYTSKTHSQGMRPQKIKITSNLSEWSGSYVHRNFCPFRLMNDFLYRREDYDHGSEQLFIFKDGTPLTSEQARKILKLCLERLGLDPSVYACHSFRIGRTTDLIKYNYSIEEVNRMGRWHSNTVYKYIKD